MLRTGEIKRAGEAGARLGLPLRQGGTRYGSCSTESMRGRGAVAPPLFPEQTLAECEHPCNLEVCDEVRRSADGPETLRSEGAQ